MPVHALRIGFLTLALLIGSVSKPAQSQPEPFEIPAVMSLTGTGAFLGATQLQGLKIVEKYINATGGVHGRPVRFVSYDSQSSPQLDVQLTTQLIGKHSPIIIDGGPAANCRAVAPLYAAGPVMYCLTPVFYPPVGSYTFVMGASSQEETHALINYMRSRKWKRVAILTTTDATGQEADRAMHELFALPENRDEKILAWEHFGVTDLSVTAQIAKIKATNPDVLMLWGTGPPAATAFRALQEAGLNVPIVASNGNQTYVQMKQYASILPSQYYQYALKWPAYKSMRPSPLKNALALMYKWYAAEGLRPDTGGSQSWDPAMIIVTALRALPADAAPEQIRAYIASLHGYSGVDGFYDFRLGNQRGLTINDCIVVRWDVKADTWLPVSTSAGAPL